MEVMKDKERRPTRFQKAWKIIQVGEIQSYIQRTCRKRKTLKE